MIFHPTRLSPVWTSLIISQIRRSHTNTLNLSNKILFAPKKTFLKLPVYRVGLHITAGRGGFGGTIMFNHNRLLQATRWTRMQFARWRHSSSSTRNNNTELAGRFSAQPKKLKFKKSDFRRLMELSKSEKYVLIAAMGCLLVSSAITMSVPFFLGRVIDKIFNKEGVSNNLDNLGTFCVILMGIFILGGLANFGRVYLFNSASLRIVRDLRSRVYRTMLLQEPGWFDLKGTGELVNRLINDTFFVGNSLSQNLSDGLRSLAMISVGTGMMMYTSPQLALVSSMIVPVMAGVAIVYGRFLRKVTRELLDKLASISKYSEERFGNIKTVKIFCHEKQESKMYDKLLENAMNLGYKEVCAKSVFFGLTGFSGNVIVISVLYYGGTLVLDNALSIGELTAFILYASYVAISINGLSNFYSELNKGVGAAQRIWEILDRKYTIPLDEGLIPIKKPDGQIKFENVFFNFPSRPYSAVLSDFTLQLHRGQITAVVGRSGSGKTTVANLLLRLYDPQNGVVLLDGHDLRSLSPQWLRSHISAVNQEPVLFSGTIRENILYGLNPGSSASDELLQEVVREAHVDEFTSQLHDGLDTLVGQRGMMLSGGQKQRVAIARALIRNPTIIVLDEATSALDSVSEQLVQTALDRMIQGRTVLTIAHRLSTIRNADKIAVIEKGKIIEQGTYDNLMININGAFRELVSKQAFIGKTS